jgi:hypothetical protein
MSLQNAVEQVLNPIAKTIILDGVLIKDLSITTSGLEIEHGLGREPQGFFVADSTADVRVWRVSWDSRIINLDASGSSVISVWVF